MASPNASAAGHDAKPAGHSAGTAAHAQAAHEQAGEVKFPPFQTETFAPQLIWLALTFVALYVMLSRIVLPRIAGVIEGRQARILRDLEQAERLKSETDQAIASYEAALTDARAKAGAIAKDMRDGLLAESERERTKTEAALNAKLGEAEARIAATKSKALGSVNDVAASVAGDVVAKLIGTSASLEEIRRALLPAAGE
jgi:F-type H+-transporting ATPase subunit b